MTGWIELITGGMFSGKTEELIRRANRARYAHQKTQVFTTLWSDDCQVGDSSHSGLHLDASAVHWPSEILAAVEADTDVVVIDEAQFFGGGIVGVCETLADQGKRVILAGLDLDFRGEPFGPMPLLMARAERVDKLRAICVVCSDEAGRSQRLVNGRPAKYGDPVILVGADEVYEARCRECHEVAR